MPSITEFYEINRPIPFKNVQVNVDNCFFVDPHAVRLSQPAEPYASEAIECMDSFLREVTACVFEGSPASLQRAETLLQQFAEPWETRLGLATSGFAGHGGAHDVGTWIMDTLTSDAEALVRVGILRHLEYLPLFVHGVDRDITSDITTRLIFGPLARFTEDMLLQYPELSTAPHEIKTFKKQVWNAVALEWDVEEFTLPVANGKALVLVPDSWVRKTLLMSATRFFETSALSFAQLAGAVVTDDGKLLKTPKDKLVGRPGLERGRSTNLRLTLQAFENEEDLLRQFTLFVASRLEPNQVRARAA